MSGGAFDYLYMKIETQLDGEMRDREMEDLIKDLVPVIKKLEWYISGDILEEDYMAEMHKFKEKWLRTPYETRVKGYVKQVLQDALTEIEKL